MVESKKKNIPKADQSKEIMDRKIEHLKIPLEYDVQHSKNYFDDLKLIHYPIPDIDFEDIDLTATFFDKKITTSKNIREIKSISITTNSPKDTNRKRRGGRFNNYDYGQPN